MPSDNIGAIFAVRADQRENHFIVLELIREEYELVVTTLRPVVIANKIAAHKRQTISEGVPLYRQVWFVPIEIPKG